LPNAIEDLVSQTSTRDSDKARTGLQEWDLHESTFADVESVTEEVRTDMAGDRSSFPTGFNPSNAQ
jgi:isopentenyl diphosphate isomerase/L-lactate dehydrogenase-like FMN-dependent dehydrogenase